MATINLTWDACGSSSDGQYIYYGKKNIATGTPVNGTGWTLYTGAPLPNTQNSASITGLDDNVEYTIYGYCHCPSSGNGPLITQGPFIKYVCPTINTITPSFDSVSYSIAVPNSANNSGTWIQTVKVTITNMSNLTNAGAKTYSSPFSTINDSITGLNPNTIYSLSISYIDAGNTRSQVCTNSPFTTSTSCVAPTIAVNNPTASGFDISWNPSTGGTFDILVNNSVVAAGLTTSPYTATNLNPSTIYQVNVRKNCSTGGTAISQTQTITTSNASINGTISMNSDTNAVGTFANGTMYLVFTFPQPTTFPMTLYFGYTRETSCNACPGLKCNVSNGYDIFTPPPGAQNCPSFPNGETSFGGHPHYPFVVNIPQGVTTYNSGANIHTTDPSPQLPNIPWSNSGAGTNGARGYTDLYVKAFSPNGYSANFTIANGQNISGVTIHNV